MRLRRTPRRVAPETILPLIDVVFFLLVFSMLVGRMDATAPFEIAPPIAMVGTDLPGGGAMIMLSADGALALDGLATDADALRAELQPRLAAEPGLSLRINADSTAALRHLLPLVAELEALGGREIVLVVTPAAP